MIQITTNKVSPLLSTMAKDVIIAITAHTRFRPFNIVASFGLAGFEIFILSSIFFFSICSSLRILFSANTFI
jgi:hypothetical protein